MTHDLLVVAFLFVYGQNQGDATKCFECSDVPFPKDCAKVTICTLNELCSTEQVVTTTGKIIYNTGCLAKDRCSGFSGPVLLGKRAEILAVRSNTDITTCIECCEGDFCNNQGCGTQAPVQRGPYCYHCDAELDPSSCTHTAICQQNEQCLLYSPLNTDGLPDTLYISRCETRAVCDGLMQTHSTRGCPPLCCDTDFCNNHCGPQSNTSLITTQPQTTSHLVPTHPVPVTSQTHTTTVPSPVKTTEVPGCKEHHFYDGITGMCIILEESQKLDYIAAEQACETIGDQLVTIDTHEKNIFVESTILHHSRLHLQENRVYYIGLYDKHDTSEFYWPNDHQLVYNNWGGNSSHWQPDDGPGKHQDCVIIYGPDSYRWHDDHCTNTQYFICEDTLFLKHTDIVPGPTDPPGGSVLTPVPNDHLKSRCEHGGYIYLHSNAAYLCVRIVTAHPRAWINARHQCHVEGGDLVTLDTRDKMELMRNKVNKGELSIQHGYWIGARDFGNTGHFTWPDNSGVGHDADWDNGLPHIEQGDTASGCVVMSKYSREHFQWQNDKCHKIFAFICEHDIN